MNKRKKRTKKINRYLILNLPSNETIINSIKQKTKKSIKETKNPISSMIPNRWYQIGVTQLSCFAYFLRHRHKGLNLVLFSYTKYLVVLLGVSWICFCIAGKFLKSKDLTDCGGLTRVSCTIPLYYTNRPQIFVRGLFAQIIMEYLKDLEPKGYYVKWFLYRSLSILARHWLASCRLTAIRCRTEEATSLARYRTSIICVLFLFITFFCQPVNCDWLNEWDRDRTTSSYFELRYFVLLCICVCRPFSRPTYFIRLQAPWTGRALCANFVNCILP